VLRWLAPFVALSCLASCTLPEGGPSRSQIDSAAKPTASGATRFALIDLDPRIVETMQGWNIVSLQGTFGTQRPANVQTIGIGDSIQIVLWEAAAGGLFSAPVSDRVSPGSRSAVIPEQVVGADGAVTVPYAGRVPVAGRSPREVEATIVEALKTKAIEPQALVTVTKNVANTVSVLGEVTSGARIPLTTKGDRVLDVIATAGGTRAAAHDIFITLMRQGRSVRVPMQAILVDPKENIYAMPGDVIAVSRDVQTYTAIGATGRNDVLPFDAVGITLEQAIGRAGGLNDQRADLSGVFVVRNELAPNYDQFGLVRPSLGASAEVPVIYRLDMRDPMSFFLARRFQMHNKDILFVSNASATDLQKVMTILLPFLGVSGTAVAVTAATR